MFDEKEYRKKYYLKNKEKILARQRKRSKEKADYIRNYQQALYKTKNGRIIRAFASIKKNAKRRGINIEIDLQYLRSIAPDECPVFGYPFDWTSWGTNEGKAQFDTPSIDRIDSTKGYVKGNVAWISHRANAIKQNATYEELFKIANWLKQKTEENAKQ